MDTSTPAAVASFVTLAKTPNLLLPSNPFRCLTRPRASLAVCCANSHASPPPPSPLPRVASDEEEVAPPRLRLRRIAEEFRALSEADRAHRLLAYAAALPRLTEADRVAANRVMGCVAQVWLLGRCDGAGNILFAADSDSELSRGYCSCLVSALDGAPPEEVLDVDTADLAPLGVAAGARSRANTWHNVLVGMKKLARAAIAAREGRPRGEPFPSLLIGRDGAVRAQGSYAEAQAMFLSPDHSKIAELVNTLMEKKIGIVAHFYMDPEVQGILTGAKRQWPHIHISDSLVMADSAVQMAEAGCKYIAVLGVDFMSENVRAILDQAGFNKNGNCIVHDMFGHEVVEKIKEEYSDAFLTAHFEVPGEMFSLSMEAKTRGMGVVGSTQNILDFIKNHLNLALDRNVDDHLQFVLGTESGMITSIVAAVRKLFDSYGSSEDGANIEVEIVFPVSRDSVSKTSVDDSHDFGSSVTNDLEQITIVPGVVSGEGCSIHGGCASCPYMKLKISCLSTE
ncbi:hypothetical protein ACQ4PT_060793 [Festuca glaucescens]